MEDYQLCVGNLAEGITDSDLAEALRAVDSSVRGAFVALDFLRQSRGFGFVRCSGDDEAAQALHRFQGLLLAGRPIVVRATHRCPQDGSLVDANNSIFIRGLHQAVTEHWLKVAFRAFGDIESIRLLRGNVGAVLTFTEHIAALAALSLMQGASTEETGQVLQLRWNREAPDRKRERIGNDTIFSIAHGASETCATRALADKEEAGYSHEWHASMQPRPSPLVNKFSLMRPLGAPMDTTDAMYWLSRSMQVVDRSCKVGTCS